VTIPPSGENRSNPDPLPDSTVKGLALSDAAGVGGPAVQAGKDGQIIQL
jgi:hypothetical protein